MTPDPAPFKLGPDGGPAVLCLHGLTGTPWEVRPPAEALARRGFACHGPLLPGHGSSVRELARTKRADWEAACLEAFDSLAGKHPRVYVLGLSMGGVLALRCAARRPAAGLVVVAAPLRLGWAARLGVSLAGRAVESIPKTPAIADPAARAVHPGYDRMPLPAVRELILLGREVATELGRITAPLRLYYSRRDPTVPLPNGRLILERVSSRDRNLEVFERSAHVLPVDLDGPALSAGASEFLSGLEAR